MHHHPPPLHARPARWASTDRAARCRARAPSAPSARYLGPRPQRGFTLVDLLLGMGIGIFLCAVAGGLLVVQLREHRHLLAESLLQQDLRNAMALMRHQIHRSGAELDAHLLVPDDTRTSRRMRESPSVTLTREGLPAPDAVDGDGLVFTFDRHDPEEGARHLERGFRLQKEQLHFLLERSWQPWTESHTVRFTQLILRLHKEANAWPSHCGCREPSTCTAHTQRQWLDIQLTGQSLLDAATVRHLHGSVLVRNDHLLLPEASC